MFAGTVILAALFFTVGGVFMKLSEGLTKFWPTVIVFALFLVGAALQTLAMKREDLAVTVVDQLLHEESTDEAGGAGDEVGHGECTALADGGVSRAHSTRRAPPGHAVDRILLTSNLGGHPSPTWAWSLGAP